MENISTSNMSRYDSQESVFSELPVKTNRHKSALNHQTNLSKNSSSNNRLIKTRSTLKSVANSDGSIRKMLVSRSNSFSKEVLIPHLKCSKLNYTVPVKTTKYKNLVGPFSVPVGFDKSEVNILENLNCMIPKNKLTAIIGPSGCGKTTLLNALSGRLPFDQLTGDVLIQNTKITKDNRLNLRNIIGYVAQDDCMLHTLTVKENIAFSANLRLPRKVSVEEKVKRVDDLIKRLGLTRCQDTLIGNAAVRGVSGGERKRCAIAMEMVVQPKVLFLDEPTTGLDASTSLSVIALCKELAQEQTIVSVIHQPRSSLWALYDWAVIMNKGTCVYEGQANLEDLLHKHFNHLNLKCADYECPADHVLDVLQDKVLLKNGTDIHRMLKNTHLLKHRGQEIKKIARNRGGRGAQSDDWAHLANKREMGAPVDALIIPKSEMPSKFTKLKALMARSLKDYTRDTVALYSNVGVQILISLAFGFLFLKGGTSYYSLDTITTKDLQEQQSRLGLIFGFIFGIWHTTILSAAMFHNKSLLFFREVKSGYYTAGPYFLSKFICEMLPNRLVPIILYSCVTYWMGGLWKSADVFFLWLLPLLTMAMCSGSILLLYCSIFSTIQVVCQSFVLTTLLMLFSAGLTPSLNQLPVVIRWMQYISIPRYTLVNHVINEFLNLPDGMKDNVTVLTTQERIEIVGTLFEIPIEDFHYGTYWRNYGIVWAITVAAILGTYLILKMKTNRL